MSSKTVRQKFINGQNIFRRESVESLLFEIDNAENRMEAYREEVGDRLLVWQEAAKKELAQLRAEFAEACGIIIEADALSQANKKPRSYREAKFAIVSMMSHGVDAMHEVEKLRDSILRAQTKLRSTVTNWREQSLFDCDAILEDALK